MVRATTVLKCRECGAVNSLGYSQTAHRDRDHCDGALEEYCNICNKFYDNGSCVSCNKRQSEENEHAQRQRQAAIARWRSYPVIAQLDWLLCRNPICRQALDDWEARAGLQQGHKRLLICASLGLLAGTAIPSTMRFTVFALVCGFAAYASTLKTFPPQ